MEHAGEPLSAHKVEYDAAGSRSGSGRLLRVKKPKLFERAFFPGQMRLFGLAETLDDDGWLKALRLRDYAARRIVVRPRNSRRSSRTTRHGAERRRALWLLSLGRKGAEGVPCVRFLCMGLGGASYRGLAIRGGLA